MKQKIIYPLLKGSFLALFTICAAQAQVQRACALSLRRLWPVVRRHVRRRPHKLEQSCL